MSYGLLAVNAAMYGLCNVLIQVSARGLALASLPLVGVGIVSSRGMRRGAHGTFILRDRNAKHECNRYEKHTDQAELRVRPG
jgi:hypothetical protein